MTEVRIAVREAEGEGTRPEASTGAPLPLPSDQDASGRTLGDEELARVAAVLRRGTLTGTKGDEVPELEATLAARLGVPFAIACASGTAAVHTAAATSTTSGKAASSPGPTCPSTGARSLTAASAAQSPAHRMETFRASARHRSWCA